MSTEEITTTCTNKIETNFIARKRIQLDLNEIKNAGGNTSIIFADPIDDNFFHLEAAISGPMSTPYENGVFLLDLKLTDQYPVR
jgi:ubiquitin-protein ligase